MGDYPDDSDHERTLFDLWADLSFLHHKWLRGKRENEEFSQELDQLLRELKAMAEGK